MVRCMASAINVSSTTILVGGCEGVRTRQRSLAGERGILSFISGHKRTISRSISQIGKPTAIPKFHGRAVCRGNLPASTPFVLHACLLFFHGGFRKSQRDTPVENSTPALSGRASLQTATSRQRGLPAKGAPRTLHGVASHARRDI
mgnify:CR=1 FL=1